MAGRIDDIDPDISQSKGGVLGGNSDAPFPLKVTAVHHPFLDGGMGGKRSRLPEQVVHQGGLPVVDVSDCAYVPDIDSRHLLKGGRRIRKARESTTACLNFKYGTGPGGRGDNLSYLALAFSIFK